MASPVPRFRPVAPQTVAMPNKPAAPPPPPPGMPGTEPSRVGPPPIAPATPGATPTGQRPGGPVKVDPNTGDPSLDRPTYSPPRSTNNPTGATPFTMPQGTNGFRSGGSSRFPTSPTTLPATGTVPTPTVPTVPTKPPGHITKPPPVVAPPTITPTTSPVGSNLRGETYTPGGDPRLTGAQGATDAAAAAVQGANRQQMQGANEDRYRSLMGTGQIDASGFEVDPSVRFRGIDPNVAGGPAIGADESARTARYGAAQDQALEGLNGPDRTSLAMQKLKDFDAVSDEQRFKEERALGQNIAKFGRSGMQSNAGDFGEIQRKIAGDRGRLANELAMNVSEGDINDRFRRVDTTAGLRGMESGIDAGMRGERRTERDYTTGLDERNTGRQMQERDLETALNERNVGRTMDERDTRLGIAEGNQSRAFDRTRAGLDFATGQTDRGIGDGFDKLSAAGTLEDRIFGEGRSNRDEFRTERENQNRDAQMTIENRIRERELQQQEEEMRLRRAALTAQAGGL